MENGGVCWLLVPPRGRKQLSQGLSCHGRGELFRCPQRGALWEESWFLRGLVFQRLVFQGLVLHSKSFVASRIAEAWPQGRLPAALSRSSLAAH